MAKKTAEAEETGTLIVSGSDQDDGALDFGDAFDKEADDKNIDEASESKAKSIPARDVKPKKEESSEKKESDEKPEDKKPANELPKTAAERAELEAKKLDEKPAGTPAKPEEPAGDILDSLPSQYAWAKAARDGGKISEWLKQQPKSIQKLAASDDVDDVTYILDQYQKAQQPAEPTAKEVKSLLAEFGNVKFKSPDGEEKTLKSIAEEYGNEELFEAFAAMNRAMMGSNIPVLKNDGIDALQQRIDQMRIDQEFWEPILEVHPDGKKLVRSMKLKEWVDGKGTDAIKRLYKSPSSDHAILVIDAYKEAMALEVKAPADEAASKKKKQIDGLHGESLRPKRENKTPAPKDGEESPDAFDEGFEAGSKK